MTLDPLDLVLARLAELKAAPERLNRLSLAELAQVRGVLIEFDSLLLSRLLTQSNTHPESADAGDRLLTVQESAERLSTTPDYLYRNWRTLPFAVPFGRRGVRFSQRGLEDYIAKKARLKRVA